MNLKCTCTFRTLGFYLTIFIQVFFGGWVAGRNIRPIRGFCAKPTRNFWPLPNCCIRSKFSKPRQNFCDVCCPEMSRHFYQVVLPYIAMWRDNGPTVPYCSWYTIHTTWTKRLASLGLKCTKSTDFKVRFRIFSRNNTTDLNLHLLRFQLHRSFLVQAQLSTGKHPPRFCRYRHPLCSQTD